MNKITKVEDVKNESKTTHNYEMTFDSHGKLVNFLAKAKEDFEEIERKGLPVKALKFKTSKDLDSKPLKKSKNGLNYIMKNTELPPL